MQLVPKNPTNPTHHLKTVSYDMFCHERYCDACRGARFDAYETIKLRQDGTEVREYFKWNDEGCRFEECQRPPALRYSRKVHACVQFVKGHLEM